MILRQDLTQILSQKGIVFETTQAPEETTLPVLYASYIKWDAWEMAKKLLSGPLEAMPNGYMDQHYTLTVTDTYLLNYESNALHEVPAYLVLPTKEEADLVVRQFVKDKLKLSDDMEFKALQAGPKGLEVTYIQSVDDHFIEGSHIRAVVNDQEVISMSLKWFETSYESGKTTRIIPYSKALYRLMSQLSSPVIPSNPWVIKSVDIGYSLQGNLFETDIQAGETSPYYRFTLEEGPPVLIEALAIE